jgi:hypothetical protein
MNKGEGEEEGEKTKKNKKSLTKKKKDTQTPISLKKKSIKNERDYTEKFFKKVGSNSSVSEKSEKGEKGEKQKKSINSRIDMNDYTNMDIKEQLIEIQRKYEENRRSSTRLKNSNY